MKLYLITEPTEIDASYDSYAQKIDTKDVTWKSILDQIESELDAHFLANGEKLDGIKFTIEITSKLPEGTEMEQE